MRIRRSDADGVNLTFTDSEVRTLGLSPPRGHVRIKYSAGWVQVRRTNTLPKNTKAPKNSGIRMLKVYDTRAVYPNYTDYGLEGVLVVTVLPANEAVEFWGEKATSKLRKHIQDSKKELKWVTQFDYGALGTPLALTGPAARIMFILGSFPIRQAEFLASGSGGDVASRMLKYVVATEAIQATLGQATGFPIRDILYPLVPDPDGPVEIGPARFRPGFASIGFSPVIGAVQAAGEVARGAKPTEALGTAIGRTTIPGFRTVQRTLRAFNENYNLTGALADILKLDHLL